MRAAFIILLALAATAQAAPRNTDETEKATDPRDKMICKRFVETGSLVKGTRVCKTKADWERERDAIRSFNAPAACRNLGQGGNC